MRIEDTLTIVLMIVIVLTLCSALSSTLNASISVVVTAAVEKYALKEAFHNILNISVLIPVELNPHYIPIRPSMIKIVKRSEIYVPLWHFPFEYKLASSIHGIYIIKLSQYVKNGLRFLKYPNTSIVNSHGWWLDPYNMLSLVKTVEIILVRQYPSLKNIIEIYYDSFRHSIQVLHSYLLHVGHEIRRYCTDVVIVCACPAFEYLMHSMNLTCIVLRDNFGIEKLLIKKGRGKYIILLADFQKNTKYSWYFEDLIRGGNGVILYLPVLGSVNVNITYTGLLYSMSGRILEACKIISQNTGEHSYSQSNFSLIFIVYTLAILLSICLVVVASFSRNYSRRLSSLKNIIRTIY